MANETARFLRFRLRPALRRHLGSYVTVILLIGLLGGLGLASLSAARRTQSAFSQYLTTTKASDVLMQPYFQSGASLGANVYRPAFAAQLARLPGVVSVSANPQSLLAEIGANGKPYLPNAFQNNEVYVAGSEGGQYYGVDGMVADQGRLPDPSRRDEIVATASAAALLHWKLGQVIPAGFFTYAAAFASPSGVPTTPPFFRIKLHLVGIAALSSTVAHDQVDTLPQFVILTPALTSVLQAGGGAAFPAYFVRLRDHGPEAVAALEREFIDLLPSGTTYNFHQTAVTQGQVQRATKPEAIALGVFGAIAAAAALLISLLVFTRTLRADSRERETLRALGANRAMLIGEPMLGVVGAAVLGFGLALLVAVLLSPVAPLGEVRAIDPRPGLAIDWTVIGFGAVLLVGIVSLLALGLAALAARSRPDRRAGGQTSFVVSWASALGLPTPAVTGLRFAVHSGSGPESVPVTSAILGAVLAVGVVATTLTFGSGLHALVSQPSLYGWNWDYAIQLAGSGNLPAVALPWIRADHLVGSASPYNFANAQLDGQTVPILLTDNNAAVTPAVLMGHGVQSDDQVVLGPTTMAQLHAHVGGTVTLSYGAPKDAPVYIPPRTFRVVGTATLPSIGTAGALHTSMGGGAVISLSVETPAFAAAVSGGTPASLVGPDIILIRLRAGVGQADGLRSLNQIVTRIDKYTANIPQFGGGVFQVLPVQQPAEIVNYRSMGVIPSVLSGWLALGAAAALGVVLLSSVRRRRRELALLKTLGLIRNQLAAVVSWQASATAAVGALIGIPLGIVLGRVLWTFFARDISAVPQATVPVLQVVLVGVATLVLANLVALAPARLAARTPAGSVLVRD